MTPEWTLLREPEDFSALTDLAPDECVYGLGPDFETPGVVHLRADRRSMRKTSQVLSDWDVDPGGVRVVEWPGSSTAQIAAAIAPVVQRLSEFSWTRYPGARWFPLRPHGPYIVEIADGPDSSPSPVTCRTSHSL